VLFTSGVYVKADGLISSPRGTNAITSVYGAVMQSLGLLDPEQGGVATPRLPAITAEAAVATSAHKPNGLVSRAAASLIDSVAGWGRLGGQQFLQIPGPDLDCIPVAEVSPWATRSPRRVDAAEHGHGERP